MTMGEPERVSQPQTGAKSRITIEGLFLEAQADGFKRAETADKKKARKVTPAGP